MLGPGQYVPFYYIRCSIYPWAHKTVLARTFPQGNVVKNGHAGSFAVYVTTADPGSLWGLKTPQAMEGVLVPSVSVANITAKEHVYRPTSELVSL